MLMESWKREKQPVCTKEEEEEEEEEEEKENGGNLLQTMFNDKWLRWYRRMN